MTRGTHQTPRSRIREAEKQLRIARQFLSEDTDDIQSMIDDVTREVKVIGMRIEVAEQGEADSQPRQPPVGDSGAAEPVQIDAHSPDDPDGDASSDDARTEDGRSDEPHAR